MVATVVEHQVEDLRWTIVRGPRTDAFRKLGAYAAADIAAVLDAFPGRALLTSRVQAAPGRYRATEAVSRKWHPDAFAELVALADGAGVPFDDLLLINLRGDLGTGDGTGCTDLAWAGARSLIGHNEDGAPVFDGIGRLLTLLIDGEPGVCVWWYPGFVPANTFALTSRGLVWGIDNVNVVNPGPGAGRHFVARSLQRAMSLPDAVTRLRRNPSAGGFAYTLGQAGTREVSVVETAGPQTAVTPVPRGFFWHTNHLRQLPPDLDRAMDESLVRAEVCARLRREAPGVPDADWMLGALTGKPVPDGLHRDATGGDDLMTLCTMVADLADGTVTLLSRGGRPLRARLAELVSGAAGALTPVQ
jgi:hypothetical protein